MTGQSLLKNIYDTVRNRSDNNYDQEEIYVKPAFQSVYLKG